MAVSEQTTIGKIDRKAWYDEAKHAGLRPDIVLERIGEIIANLPEAADRVAGRAAKDGIDEAFAQHFAEAIRAEAIRRLAMLR
jgi:hypothetical protein